MTEASCTRSDLLLAAVVAGNSPLLNDSSLPLLTVMTVYLGNVELDELVLIPGQEHYHGSGVRRCQDKWWQWWKQQQWWWCHTSIAWNHKQWTQLPAAPAGLHLQIHRDGQFDDCHAVMGASYDTNMYNVIHEPMQKALISDFGWPVGNSTP